MRPLAHLTDEELRAEVRALANPAPKRSLGMAAVLEWALEFGVLPGHSRGIEAADLYRHFLAHGYRLDSTQPAVGFGHCLSRLGLSKGRLHVGPHDMRPRLMTRTAADYFQAWVLKNPRPADADRFRLGLRKP